MVGRGSFWVIARLETMFGAIRDLQNPELASQGQNRRSQMACHELDKACLKPAAQKVFLGYRLGMVYVCPLKGQRLYAKAAYTAGPESLSARSARTSAYFSSLAMSVRTTAPPAYLRIVAQFCILFIPTSWAAGRTTAFAVSYRKTTGVVWYRVGDKGSQHHYELFQG
jgi:hypothetical protein